MLKLIQSQKMYSHLLDVGGCSLHHLQNAARYGVDAFKSQAEDILNDIYCHFKFSATESALYSEVIPYCSLFKEPSHMYLLYVIMSVIIGKC
jgi:hypothetical protein